ncbi:hypothetical protein GCM10027059_46210 [Myceligenerans halotolerans]
MHALFDFKVRLAPRPGAAEKLTETLAASGIGRAAVSAGGVVDLPTLSRQLVEGGHVTTDPDNDEVLAFCRRSAERFVPFYFANPHRPPGEYARRAAEFRGCEISPAVHGVPLTDPRVAALVRVAARARHPVYVVCLIRPGCGVADLVALARAHPDATFVLGHAGTGNIDLHALELVADVPNVLVETSGGYTSVLSAALRRLGPERLLFGSEYPLQHPQVELAKFRAVGITPDAWELVGRRNAHRVLGLEELS